jgi:hypothetical protein
MSAAAVPISAAAIVCQNRYLRHISQAAPGKQASARVVLVCAVSIDRASYPACGNEKIANTSATSAGDKIDLPPKISRAKTQPKLVASKVPPHPTGAGNIITKSKAKLN